MLGREDVNRLLMVIDQDETDCGRLALPWPKIMVTQPTTDADQAAEIRLGSDWNPAAALRLKPFR